MINVGGGDVMLRYGVENLHGDEITIVSVDKTKIGSYTLIMMDAGDGMKILNQVHDESPNVRGKGICEAMLPELYEYYKKPIISSSKRVPVMPGEGRVKNVTGNYEEMMARDVVRYDSDRDVYIYVPKKEG